MSSAVSSGAEAGEECAGVIEASALWGGDVLQAAATNTVTMMRIFSDGVIKISSFELLAERLSR